MTDTPIVIPSQYLLSLSHRPAPLCGSHHTLMSGAIFIEYTCHRLFKLELWIFICHQLV